LRLSWDKADAPSLGLWLNVRAWSGSGSPPYFNLGVEPSTAPCDDLTTAIKSGHGRHLAPGETHSWEFTLAVERSVCGPRMHAPPAHCVPVFRS